MHDGDETGGSDAALLGKSGAEEAALQRVLQQMAAQDRDRSLRANGLPTLGSNRGADSQQ
jgi:hypothetical protein